MRVLHVAAEMTPIAKVGGLGDVLMGLTRELSRNGNETLAIIPRYGAIDMKMVVPEGTKDLFETWFDGCQHKAQVTYYRLSQDIRVGLLDTEDGFWEKMENIYGNDGEVANFVFFSRAVVDWLVTTKKYPDVLHVHDWQVALVPLILKNREQHSSIPSILTIHNLEYQGLCQWHDLERAQILPENFSDKTILQDPSRDCLNLLKAGILSANIVTTVSPTYAKEVKTDECGRGLQTIIQGLQDKFVGVLNGVDYSYWNPEIDIFLKPNYGVRDGIEKIRRAKLKNRQEVGKLLGIPEMKDTPLIASISRLVPQKGVSLVYDLFSKAEQFGIQAILLGSLSGREDEAKFTELDLLLRKQGRGAVCTKSDESLAHKIYAAADIFVAPSIFEPCGLTQLIALRYGTIPVVRKTGGLADTILDVSSGEGNNGFLFKNPNQQDFEAACTRALSHYKNTTSWNDLVLRGMSQDFSWKKPTAKYIELYRRLCSENSLRLSNSSYALVCKEPSDIIQEGPRKDLQKKCVR